jgi:protein tyrosine phosphatase (PTP) superfamily phosphohydrolase (DUF442 family)
MRLDQADLLIKRYNIKTVIDLRLGNQSDHPSERTEQDVAQSLGATYHHIAFRSTRIPPPGRVQKLLDTIKDAETPVWIHCSNGTHRSGFAALLWMLTREGANFDTAKTQLSADHGFLRLERDIRSIRAGRATQDSVVWKYDNDERLQETPFITWLLEEIEEVKPKNSVA